MPPPDRPPVTQRPPVVRPGDAFRGEVEPRAFRWRDAGSGFAVVAGRTAGGPLVLVGTLAHLPADGRWDVAGTWERDERFGLQLRVAHAAPAAPSGRDATLAVLRRLPGLGARRAAWLWERHGEALPAALDADAERVLRDVPGLGVQRALKAARAWRELGALRALVELLAPHGLAWLAPRLDAELGAGAADAVRRDPYALVGSHGVGFARADALARGLGVPADGPERTRAGVLHVLAEAERGGSSGLPEPELVRRAAELDLRPAPGDLDALAAAGTIAVEDAEDGRWAFRTAAYRDETSLAAAVARLVAAGPLSWVRVPPAGADLGDGGLEPHPEQRRAVERAFAHRLSIVTGGPGTGKTTILRLLCAEAAQQGLVPQLVAPTGRAAVRMTEATGEEASTVHAALGWIPGSGPQHDAEEPLGCELLVCDETSMATTNLLATLLAAVGDRTHVVLVGDADQLPPVGAGAPFRELVAGGRVPVTRLEHVFRQRARSAIVRAAHAVRRGEPPPLGPAQGVERDLWVLERDDPGAAAAEIADLVADRLPRHFGVAGEEILVLAPAYRGELGITALNERLRERLNPHGEPVAGGRLRAGDRVMMTGRNRPDLGLMNGTTARLLGEGEGGELRLALEDGAEVELPAADAERIQPAYAVSVHRAQGQDVPVAIVVLDRGHAFMLRRELVYTAITRARTATVVVGQAALLAAAARRPDTTRRWTRLGARVSAALEAG